MCMFEITSDARIWFQMASWATLPVIVRAHVGDVIIVWCNMHNNTEPNAIWFLATLTDTDLNIQGIQVKYRTNGNCNIPATESRLWGTKLYYLFSAQVRMFRRGAFGIFYTTIFNWTFKNCVSRRGSSRASATGAPVPWLGYQLQQVWLGTSEQFKFISMQFDMCANTVAPLPKMRVKVKTGLDHWRSCPMVAAWDLHRMLGMLIYMATLVTTGRLHFCPILWWASDASDSYRFPAPTQVSGSAPDVRQRRGRVVHHEGRQDQIIQTDPPDHSAPQILCREWARLSQCCHRPSAEIKYNIAPKKYLCLPNKV